MLKPVEDGGDGRGTVWPLLAALVLVVALTVLWQHVDAALWTALGAALDWDEMSKAVGYSLIVPAGVTLALWLALYLRFLRDVFPPRGGLYLLIMLLAMSAAGLVYGLVQWPVAYAAAEPQRAQLHEAIGAMHGALVVALDPAAAPLDMRVTTTGDAGTMERSFKQMLTGVRKAAQAYRATAVALDYPALMTPARLGAARDLGDTLARLQKAESAMWGYNEYLGWIGRQGQSLILALPVGDREKAVLGYQFAASTGREIFQRQEILQSDVYIYDRLEKRVKFLIQTKGQWSVAGGRMRFRRAGDQAFYDNDVAMVRDLEHARQIVQDNARATSGFSEP